ncbi:uncharacterized protein LOC26515415 isoform X2 [Drosophila ananassae]|nr:uncharacterized protein LOC26515415 isoform X2 [Drosophila ananassae]
MNYLIVFLLIGKVRSHSHLGGKKAFYEFPTETQKFEFCIKLILVCRFVRDRPEDYTDSDEYGLHTNETDIYFNNIMSEYRRANCLPKGLSKTGMNKFSQLILRWTNEVKQMFLNPKLFIVVDEDIRGRSFKVNFGSMQGWCNGTDDEPSAPRFSTTTTAKPDIQISPDVCYEESVVGRWLVPETKGLRQLEKLFKRYPEFLEKLHKYTKLNCCPYGAIRDRIEIINDGIDFLHELQGIESFSKAEYSGVVSSDFSKLRDRLEYLILINNKNGGNHSSEKCCSGFMDLLKKFGNDFENNLRNLKSSQPNFDATPYIERYKGLENGHVDRLKIFQNLEALFGNKNKADACCDNKNNTIYELEKLLKDLKPRASIENKTNIFDPIKENLANSDEILSRTKSLIGLEDVQLQKLESSCGKSCHTNKKKIIQDLNTKMDALNRKYGEINALVNLNWSKLNKSLEEVSLRVNEMPDIIANMDKIKKPIPRSIKRASLSESSSITSKYLKEISIVSKTIDETNITNKRSLFIHEMHESHSKNQTIELKETFNNIEESIRKYNSTTSNKELSSFENDFNRLAKEIRDLNDIEIGTLATTIKNRKREFDLENEKFMKQFEDFTRTIKLKIEIIKKDNSKMEHRLLQLENKLNTTPTKFEERLNYMEVAWKAISKLYGLPEESYLGRIELAQKHLRDLNEAIARMEQNAEDCIYECDLGELPTIAQLFSRIKVLREKLKKTLKPKKN